MKLRATYAKWHTGAHTGVSEGPSGRLLRIVTMCTVTGLVSVTLAATLLRAAGQWGLLSPVQQALLAGAVVATAASIAVWRTPAAPHVVAFAAWLLCAAVIVPGGAGVEWAPIPNAVTCASYATVVVAPRLWPLLSIPASAGAMAYLIVSDPLRVITWSPALPWRWLMVAHVVAGSLALWIATGLLRAEALKSDAAFAETERRGSASIDQQERAMVWRFSAARVHESLLNTIRYVLGVAHPDRERLRSLLAQTAGSAAETSTCSVSGLFEADGEFDGCAVHIPVSTAAVDLDPDVFEVARAALVELVRNARHHGRATSVHIDCALHDHTWLEIAVRDNGTGMHAGRATGVGLGTVLGAAVQGVGGTVVLHSSDDGVTASLRVPIHVARDRGPAEPVGYDQPVRLLISAPLAGAAVVAGLLPLRMLEQASVAGAFVAAACLTALVFAVAAVVRRQVLSGRATVLAATAGAIVPWLLIAAPTACTPTMPEPSILNLSGFAVVLIGLWGRWPAILLPLGVWAAGASLLVAGVPAQCTAEFLQAGITTAVVVPMVAVVAFAGIRAAVRANRRIAAMQTRACVEAARARSYAEFNEHLAAAAGDARATLLQIADSSSAVDDDLRQRLLQCDARLRAAIQIDPRTAGGLARAAADLVEEATSAGGRVTVRSIASEVSEEPVPREICAWLATVLAPESASGGILQVLDDGAAEHLTLSGSGAAPKVPGRVAKAAREARMDIEVVAEGAGAHEWLVIVSRTRSGAAL